MFRGTTPTFIFELDTDIDLTTLSQVWVTIEDVLNKQFTWDIDDVEIYSEHKTITLALTQAESLAMTPGIGSVQIRMLTNRGVALTTYTEPLRIDRIIKEGVISNE